LVSLAIFFIAYFHVLGLFIAKKNVLDEKSLSVRHAKNPRALLVGICIDDISAALRADLIFRLPFIIKAGFMHLLLRISKF
jgi:hypothetical protein